MSATTPATRSITAVSSVCTLRARRTTRNTSLLPVRHYEKRPRAAKRERYILDAGEIGKLRAALDVPAERLLIELTLTTGMRSGEIRGLTWDSIDLEGKRLFIERQANRRGETAATKTESSVRAHPDHRVFVARAQGCWKLRLSDHGSGSRVPPASPMLRASVPQSTPTSCCGTCCGGRFVGQGYRRFASMTSGTWPAP